MPQIFYLLCQWNLFESRKSTLNRFFVFTFCIGCWLLISDVSIATEKAAENHYIVATTHGDKVAPLLFSAAEQSLNVDFELVEVDSQRHGINLLEVGRVDFVANVVSSDINGDKIVYSSPTNLEPVFADVFSLQKLSYRGSSRSCSRRVRYQIRGFVKRHRYRCRKNQQCPYHL